MSILLTHGATSKYSKVLFESRKKIIDSGLVRSSRGENSRINRTSKNGAGYRLWRGFAFGSQYCLRDSIGVGIDIAKEGILAAARHYPEQIWCVGDLAKSPFAKHSFDVILNILSPANYEEFKRLLTTGGCVVKVVPQSGYLQQLRAQLYADSTKETYSNEQTVERFRECFTKVTVERITYTVPLAAMLVPALLEMTPMGWHKAQQTAVDVSEITIDVDILIGQV
ncbi:SAM-dependent methyltransferase OS=Lysinibacillus sphaericus OX=1421 GN=LS41612_02135 PE=4 SV=1 [Lysinibacillus sphaericus]